jgi:hypothetical protein
MSIKLSYQEKLGYLVLKASGQWDSDSIPQGEALRAVAQERDHTRVFIDARELSQPTKEMDRFFVGELAAQHWQGLKVAVLARPEILDRFAENTVVNRGAYFAVFSDEDAALEWLIS